MAEIYDKRLFRFDTTTCKLHLLMPGDRTGGGGLFGRRDNTDRKSSTYYEFDLTKGTTRSKILSDIGFDKDPLFFKGINIYFVDQDMDPVRIEYKEYNTKYTIVENDYFFGNKLKFIILEKISIDSESDIFSAEVRFKKIGDKNWIWNQSSTGSLFSPSVKTRLYICYGKGFLYTMPINDRDKLCKHAIFENSTNHYNIERGNNKGFQKDTLTHQNSAVVHRSYGILDQDIVPIKYQYINAPKISEFSGSTTNPDSEDARQFHEGLENGFKPMSLLM